MNAFERPLLAAAVLWVGIIPSHAQNASSFTATPPDAPLRSSPVSPQMACAAIERLVLPEVSYLKSRHAEATDQHPAHCQVTGVIQPEIQFEITLPDAWNRRLYMFGNGGYAGENLAEASRQDTRNAALRQGFAVVQQNSGHDARAQPLGSFAENNLGKLVDYASRGVHVTVVTAKDMIRAYYDRGPAYSYWDGCSTGGRQGLMSAQRYPGDFDGILAGAPVLDFSGTQLWGVWNAQALAKAPISIRQLPAIAKAVLDKCDAVDGAKDGLLADPRQCSFNPAQDLPKCTEGQTGDQCFTQAQVETLQTIYGGVKSKGEVIFPGQLPGAEPADASGASGWKEWIVTEGAKSRQLAYGESFLKYFANSPASQPNLDWKQFNFDKDVEPITRIREILDANNPDLSEFEKRGGRLITYFGWADPALNPMMGVNYYERVRQAMGEDRTSNFYRLFMVPGMFHCRGGFGPDRFDAMTPLINWVEIGKAPESIQARQMTGTEVRRTRPLCPYPQVATYSGAGSMDEAASFSCAEP
jgi:feruloyl esterase